MAKKMAPKSYITRVPYIARNLVEAGGIEPPSASDPRKGATDLVDV